ncbi:MAG: serine hydrolase, partial [Clostridia bacterium]|nr:serine hydrolase [Clostridia bacterium]
GVKTITLRHLLTMSSGFGGAFLMGVNRRPGEGMPDYVGYMLAKKLVYAPGEKFVYSNADTHLAGCMVEKAVGETLLRYAYRKLFAPLGIGYPAWETDPAGTAFGGSGLYLRNEEMMRLGILYLQEGVWNGERLLSREWVKQAGAQQIATGIADPWSSGYGYQFWMIPQRENAFRADGAYGQYSLVFPKENAVVGIQCCEENDLARFGAMLRRHLLGE